MSKEDGGLICPHCGSDENSAIRKIKPTSRARLGLRYCRACKRQFTKTVGTHLHRAKLNETQQRAVLALLAAGLPINFTARAIGIPYKTAWRYSRMLLTGELKNFFAVQQGCRGGLVGGKARAAKLSPERRREIALKAIRTRWERKGKVIAALQDGTTLSDAYKLTKKLKETINERKEHGGTSADAA